MNTPLPLDEFPLAKRVEIERLAALPTAPPQWIRVVGAWLPSRAYYEWQRRHRKERYITNRDAVLLALLRRDGPICGICQTSLGVGEEIHIDHIVPVVRGGPTVLSNLQRSHPVCNLLKGASLLTEDSDLTEYTNQEGEQCSTPLLKMTRT